MGKKVINFSPNCVEIDLSRPLSNAIEMCMGSYSWVQHLDYETLPFCCHLCREYGHLQWRYLGYKSRETQPSQHVSNLPNIDKGKSIFLNEVGDSDGFAPIKDKTQNRGQKRPFKERHDDGSFN